MTEAERRALKRQIALSRMRKTARALLPARDRRPAARARARHAMCAGSKGSIARLMREDPTAAHEIFAAVAARRRWIASGALDQLLADMRAGNAARVEKE